MNVPLRVDCKGMQIVPQGVRLLPLEPMPSSPSEPPPARRDPSIIRLGLVEYLNMQPLVAGLEQSPHARGMELWSAPPARLVNWMERGRIDAGMIPVAAALDHPQWQIVGTSMIGARGPVQSVLAMGPAPVASWARIAADPHSRTSNLLAQIILRRKYGTGGELIPPTPDVPWALPPSPIPGQANILIGTHAFEFRDAWRGHNAVTLDLAQEWFAWTGLPFVFAAWIVRPEVKDRAWLDALDAHRRDNAGRIEAIVRAWPHLAREHLSVEQGVRYLTESIDFDLDDAAREGLRRFHAEARALVMSA